MSKTEWFRRTTWTDVDREDFNTRLKRSRGASNKAQYLRVQSVHLSEADLHEGAVELLDRMFAEFPESIDIAQAHAQKAESLAKLQQIDGAIQEYRAALQSERALPNVRTNAWLDFGWLIVERQLTDFYREISQVLHEFREEDGITFPAIEYRYAAIQAILADASGSPGRAREFAKQALAAATKVHSGLRYHPTVGLVGSEWNTFEKRMKALAGG